MRWHYTRDSVTPPAADVRLDATGPTPRQQGEVRCLARQGAAVTSVCVKSFPLNRRADPVAFANA